MRGQKGITLVALIITIIVLLILAVVSISTINDSGLIQNSQAGVNKWEQEAAKENNTLKNYADMINGYIK